MPGSRLEEPSWEISRPSPNGFREMFMDCRGAARNVSFVEDAPHPNGLGMSEKKEKENVERKKTLLEEKRSVGRKKWYVWW